jgi:hypothetical protein
VTGAKVLPGLYRATILAPGVTLQQSVEVRADPRHGDVSDAEREEQLAFAQDIRAQVDWVNKRVMEIRSLREGLMEDCPLAPESRAVATGLQALADIESRLYQVRNQSPKDKIAYPIQLNDRLSMLFAQVVRATGGPTTQQREVFAILMQEVESARSSFATHRRRLHTALAHTGCERFRIGSPMEAQSR